MCAFCSTLFHVPSFIVQAASFLHYTDNFSLPLTQSLILVVAQGLKKLKLGHQTSE